MNYRLLLTLILLVPATALAEAEAENTAMKQTHEEQIRDWRQHRNDRLASDSGWLTLVGLEWLQEGENQVGSGASSTIKMPGGPAHWGTIHVDGDELRFVPAPNSGVTVNGAEATEVLLVADKAGTPTLISSGNLSFYVIFRESYALRIKDSQAPALQGFTGVQTYDFQPDWKFNARFIPAEEGQTIEIANVLGHFSPSPVYGLAEFERDGVNYRLLALGDESSESLWFLFADRTSGRETYGAGRFLYSDGMPENGRLLVDFNKAYNPPCAFNDYSTCPLPPQQNRLDLAVTAGEKDYHSK
jgi:uncharacterized protein (DUF1684 family)